jgi:putative FmdB family regulatory protein
VPLYDFACQSCAARFEAFLSYAELPVCPACGAADVQRVLSPFAGPFTVGLRGNAARRSNAVRRAREEQRREERGRRRQPEG